MVIGYLKIVGIAFDETETNSPLVIYRYGILSFSIASKRMEPVAGRHQKIIYVICKMDKF